jgi:hypothetical protein
LSHVPRLAPLEQVLADRGEWSDEIVHRFIEDFGHQAGPAGISFSQAEEVFLETKRWLWFCAYRKTEFDQGRVAFAHLPLASEAMVIDLMWHTFLLFTKDYSDFCHRHFGFLIHHYPMSRAQKQAAADAQAQDPSGYRAQRMAELRPVYEYIHDVLGRDVLVRWLDEFPKKYASFGI